MCARSLRQLEVAVLREPAVRPRARVVTQAQVVEAHRCVPNMASHACRLRAAMASRAQAASACILFGEGAVWGGDRRPDITSRITA